MNLSDPVKIAFRSFTAAKLRFFLTVLGIVIGVMAVILVVSIGASAQNLLISQVEKIGSNLIAVLPGASEEDGPPASALGVVTTTLRNSDLEAIRKERNVPHALYASGYVTGSALVESPGETFQTSYQGVSPEMAQIENIEIADGRFFFEEEEFDLSRVIVLGSARAEELFPNRDPVGETVVVGDIPFRVIGVLSSRGATAFSSPDNMVYVPLGTAQKLLLGIDYLNFVRMKVDTVENVDLTKDDVTALLRDRHDIDEGEISDFSVRSTDQALQALGDVTDALRYFLAAIAAISLLVGGIGIMNSMLISVNQRVREVGLRKAVGARSGHILTQFLIESSVITIIGGIIGIILGIAIAYVASVIISSLGYEWAFLVPPSSILLGFGVSLGIGLLFGLYPAKKAAGIPPIEALRYE